MNTSISHDTQAAAERFAHRVTARLAQGTDDLPYDISERLRASRMQALARRKIPMEARRAAPTIIHAGNTAALHGGDGHLGWWNVLISSLPILALLVGLVAIDVLQDEFGAKEAAEVDAALLTDDLPPEAYADPGFLQFLKTSAPDR